MDRFTNNVVSPMIDTKKGKLQKHTNDKSYESSNAINHIIDIKTEHKEKYINENSNERDEVGTCRLDRKMENKMDETKEKTNELKPLLSGCRKLHVHSLGVTPSAYFQYAPYAIRKSIGQVVTFLTLISSNATQLKDVIDLGPSYKYYEFMLVSLVLSILLQIVGGALIVWIGKRETKLRGYTKEDKGTRKTSTIGKVALIIVFLVCIVNVLINSFSHK